MTPGHQCDSTEKLEESALEESALEESALEGRALEGCALEEGALEEGTLEEGALEEGANVSKSDEQVEQVNKSAEVYYCYNCNCGLELENVEYWIYANGQSEVYYCWNCVEVCCPTIDDNP